MGGFDGKVSEYAFSMTFSLRRRSCVMSLPKGLYPYSISKRMTPTDQMSTLVDTLANSFVKHSGGRYQ